MHLDYYQKKLLRYIFGQNFPWLKSSIHDIGNAGGLPPVFWIGCLVNSIPKKLEYWNCLYNYEAPWLQKAEYIKVLYDVMFQLDVSLSWWNQVSMWPLTHSVTNLLISLVLYNDNFPSQDRHFCLSGSQLEGSAVVVSMHVPHAGIEGIATSSNGKMQRPAVPRGYQGNMTSILVINSSCAGLTF